MTEDHQQVTQVVAIAFTCAIGLVSALLVLLFSTQLIAYQTSRRLLESVNKAPAAPKTGRPLKQLLLSLGLVNSLLMLAHIQYAGAFAAW